MNSSTPIIETKKTIKHRVNGRPLLVAEDTLRYNNLNFIRTLLAISVLYSHCYVIFYGTEHEVEPLMILSNDQLGIGTLAVNFFFLISGFLILMSWQNKPDFISFLKRRIARIFPGFIVASLLCLFLFAPLGTGDFYKPLGYWKLYFQSIDWKLISLNILQLIEPQPPWTLKNAPISNSINAPMWTIRYEFICYLIVPLLGLLRITKIKYLILLMFLLIFGTFVYQTYAEVWFWDWKTDIPGIGQPNNYIRFGTYFLGGMSVYLFRENLIRSRWFLLVSVIVIVNSVFYFDSLVITLPIFGSYILFHLAFARSYSLSSFSQWGDFSYGVYLFAWPIQQLVVLYFEQYLDIALMFILSLGATLVLAYFSWHYVEKPFLNLVSTKKPQTSPKL